MNSRQSSVPPVLYKYLNADRLNVLTNCRIRFSQRSVFRDDHELQPDYDSYGTVDQIKKQLQSVRTACPWWMPIDLLARLIAISPKHQQTALQTAVKNIKSIDQMGILCLTVAAQSEQMWNEYAQSGTGFVISFDTTHVGFRKMTAPMGIHKVTYSGEEFPTFLGMVETNPFEPLYRKRLNYSYEQEWRSLRLLKDLEPHPNNVFLASLDPRSILEIVIRSACAVGPQIRDIVAHDGRYDHVRIVTA
jgi:Protein of unknown function (DUF2971)